MSLRLLICGIYSLALIAPATAVRADDGAQERDRAITQQVELLIARRPDLGTLITVQTKDGVVFLGGESPTPFAKTNAEEIAKQVVGVTKVVDLAGVLE